MSKYFFVDYENVGALSLMGIEFLCPDDKLVLVMTDNESNRINIDMVKKLSKAIDMKLVINRIEKHDAADFRIIAEIGIFMRTIRKTKDEIYVLTEDKGFDAAIVGFRDAGYNIQRTQSIAKAYNSTVNYKKELQQVLARIYKYKLIITQFNDKTMEIGEDVSNQKSLVRIVYLMYKGSKTILSFKKSLEESGFNGYVVNGLVYVFNELKEELVI